MAEYKSNSHRSKTEGVNAPAEKKEIKKVVSGKVMTKKKSGVSKFASNFVNEDLNNVKNYVLMDVLIPSLKSAISDIVRNSIDMMLFGEVRGNGRKSNSSYVSYNKYSDSSYRSRDDRYESRRSSYSSGYAHDDIVLESRKDAEEVLERMDEIIDTYGQVSVQDMYDLIGKSGVYTDNNYGWTNIRNAEPVRVRDGWLLKMPKVTPLDR